MTSLPRLAVSCPLLRLTTRCHRPAGGLNAPLWPRLLDAPCERCALRFRAGGRGGARGLRTAARVRPLADEEDQSITLRSHSLSSPGVKCWVSPAWPVNGTGRRGTSGRQHSRCCAAGYANTAAYRLYRDLLGRSGSLQESAPANACVVEYNDGTKGAMISGRSVGWTYAGEIEGQKEPAVVSMLGWPGPYSQHHAASGQPHWITEMIMNVWTQEPIHQ